MAIVCNRRQVVRFSRWLMWLGGLMACGGLLATAMQTLGDGDVIVSPLKIEGQQVTAEEEGQYEIQVDNRTARTLRVQSTAWG